MNESAATSVERAQGRPWRTYVNSRRFAWFHLGCASVAGAIWYLSDGRAGPWPLAIAGLPLMARVASGHFPTPRTRFDPLLLLFLISAAIGVWAGHDPVTAWAKFWLILGSFFVFYAVAGQRAANLWPLLAGISFFGAATGLYFLLTHDWTEIPAKLDALNRAGLALMSVRPTALNNLHRLHPNVAGGIVAMLFPIALAVGLRSIVKRRYLVLMTSIGSVGIMLLALALTTSRGAWLALLGGLIGWSMWIGAGRLANSLYLSRRKTLGLAGSLLVGIFLSVLLLSPGGLIGFLDRLPGPTSAGSRWQLAGDALDLAGDFWPTGAGLGSFDGLYSQYIQVIPFHAVVHSHNLFLNVTIEQGILGLLALAMALILSFWWLADPQKSGYRRSIHGFSPAAGATFAALIVMCLHGLVDDPLYGSRGVLLLGLPLGLTAMLFPLRKTWRESMRSADIPAVIGMGIVAVLAALLLLLYRSPILSAWNSALGSIAMARVDLVDYPSGRWSDGQEVSSLSTAQSLFERALLFDRYNRTAWHRLGLIDMLERDYEASADALYNAYLLDRNHRGVRKALAYSYVWTGDLERALPFLLTMPEAEQELAAYGGWWVEQGFPIHARQAEDARSLLVEHLSSQ